MTTLSNNSSADEPQSRTRRLQFNPNELEIIPAGERAFWERMAEEVQLEVADRFRKKWTRIETVTVITATPDQTYLEIGHQIGRSPGAVRYRRQAMIHLLRDEHDAHERVQAYLTDSKKNHKYADYAQVYEALKGIGYLDKPVSEQFALALPLGQPSASWRGDGTSAALGRQRKQRDDIFALIERLAGSSVPT
ncbi:hypothetical protein [Streptosporangium lutulentum]|uniref:Uncharacterized protein n=1 Tax=Streptosporangium lutulentum TaxID=1461250 RepID=A0ABT9QPI9_9ACTN|nr:hypothetical protein [Streptosporangium lutulentum]MDP9848647.1 hypothetical protein [Streptosporangium lutulentum]